MNTTCFVFPSAPQGQPSWVADPSCRGTFGIVSLCLSTTVICIWSSVHRDIPLKRLSAFRSILRDLPLVLVALFAPELLLYFAFNQFLFARRIARLVSEFERSKAPSDESGTQSPISQKSLMSDDVEMGTQGHQDQPGVENDGLRAFEKSLTSDDVELGTQGHQDQSGVKDDDAFEKSLMSDDVEMVTQGHQDQPGVENDGLCAFEGMPYLAGHKVEKRSPFTLAHAFYATMGGFAFRGSLTDDGNIDGRCMKLDGYGVLFLLEHDPGLIPDISLTSITDRSKSSGLSKALLFVQVAWFCVNCVSRLAEHLPLSLLEVTTLAHGLFTLLSFAAWWHKPLNIDEPTWIPLTGEDPEQCERAREALALMLALAKADIPNLFEEDDNPSPSLSPSIRALALRAANRYGFSDLDRAQEGLRELNDGIRVTYNTVPPFKEFLEAPVLRGSSVWGEALDYAITAAIPMMYGLLHFLGRHARFPTKIEQCLWNVASLIILSAGSVLAVEEFLTDRALAIEPGKNWEKMITSIDRFIAFSLVPFVYVLGAAFLLLESIRQLW